MSPAMFPFDPVQQLRERAAAREAELRSRGWRFLTLIHGDLETPEQATAVSEISRVAHRQPSYRGLSGSNDTTTWKFLGPDADQAVANVQAAADEHNPGWWYAASTMLPDYDAYRRRLHPR